MPFSKLFSSKFINFSYDRFTDRLCACISVNAWFVAGWMTFTNLGYPPSFVHTVYLAAGCCTVLLLWLVNDSFSRPTES